MDNIIFIDYSDKLNQIYTGLEQIYGLQALALVIGLVLLVLYLLYRVITIFMR